jgi:hypothetical protein
LTSQGAGLILFHEEMSVGARRAPLAAEIAAAGPRLRSTRGSEVGVITQRLVDRGFTGKAVQR